MGVFTVYTVAKLAMNGMAGTVNVTHLGVEPLMFGVFCMGMDMLLIAMKRPIRSVFADAKAKARGTGKNS